MKRVGAIAEKTIAVVADVSSKAAAMATEYAQTAAAASEVASGAAVDIGMGLKAFAVAAEFAENAATTVVSGALEGLDFVGTGLGDGLGARLVMVLVEV